MRIKTDYEARVKIDIEQSQNRQADLTDIKDERVRNEILEKIKEPNKGVNIDIEL